jgi:hypothetical protein
VNKGQQRMHIFTHAKSFEICLYPPYTAQRGRILKAMLFVKKNVQYEVISLKGTISWEPFHKYHSGTC